jgi:hypothetical protein
MAVEDEAIGNLFCFAPSPRLEGLRGATRGWHIAGGLLGDSLGIPKSHTFSRPQPGPTMAAVV